MMKNVDLKSLLKSRNMRLADLSAALDVEKSTVTRWAAGRIPAERILDVEKATGIPRSELRPDIFDGSAA